MRSESDSAKLTARSCLLPCLIARPPTPLHSSTLPTPPGGKRAGKRLYAHNEIDHPALFEILGRSDAEFLLTYDYAPPIVELTGKHGFSAVQVTMKNTHHAIVPELVITRPPGVREQVEIVPEQRYGICEWYGEPLAAMAVTERERLARISLSPRKEVAKEIPKCPYQSGSPACSKRGGVCSLQRYNRKKDGTLGSGQGEPVIVCPARFEQGQDADTLAGRYSRV